MLAIRYIDRVNLKESAFLSVLKKYIKELKLERDISVVFDKRIKGFGSYSYSLKTQSHIIRINPKNREEQENGRAGPWEEADKFNIIATVLHEMYHAHQYEVRGTSYYNSSFEGVRKITNPGWSEWYSHRELEARIFEYKNIREAVRYYNSRCTK